MGKVKIIHMLSSLWGENHPYLEKVEIIPVLSYLWGKNHSHPVIFVRWKLSISSHLAYEKIIYILSSVGGEYHPYFCIWRRKNHPYLLIFMRWKLLTSGKVKIIHILSSSFSQIFWLSDIHWSDQEESQCLGIFLTTNLNKFQSSVTLLIPSLLRQLMLLVHIKPHKGGVCMG